MVHQQLLCCRASMAVLDTSLKWRHYYLFFSKSRGLVICAKAVMVFVVNNSMAVNPAIAKTLTQHSD